MDMESRQSGVLSRLAKRGVAGRVDGALRSLALLERSGTVRRVIDLSIRGIRVPPIPSCLDGAHGAVLVSNYPSVSQSLRAVIKVGCRVSRQRPRLKAVARPEVVTEASALLKALGIDRFVFPAEKDQAGVYRLHARLVKEVLTYLDRPGNILWLSITGRTRGNGLLEGDLRTGAALLSIKKGIPLVPMGLITKEAGGRPRVVEVRFGEPIHAPGLGGLGDFEKTDLLIDLSKLAMCHVARLLPPGQRGDFEDAEGKLAETERRLKIDLS